MFLSDIMRSHAVRIAVYLDDRLGSARDFARCEAA